MGIYTRRSFLSILIFISSLSSCATTPINSTAKVTIPQELLLPSLYLGNPNPLSEISVDEWRTLFSENTYALSGEADLGKDPGIIKMEKENLLIGISTELLNQSTNAFNRGRYDAGLRLFLMANTMQNALNLGGNKYLLDKKGLKKEDFQNSLKNLNVVAKLDGLANKLRMQEKRDKEQKEIAEKAKEKKRLALIKEQKEKEDKRLALLKKKEAELATREKITGAFGFKLGQEKSGYTGMTLSVGDAKTFFAPKKKLSLFSAYWFVTTPISKKINLIGARGEEFVGELSSMWNCYKVRDSIAEFLEKKYGTREPAVDPYGSERVLRHTVTIKQNQKEILISCESNYTRPHNIILEKPYVRIIYIDRDLFGLSEQEYELIRKQEEEQLQKSISDSTDAL